MDWSVFKDPEYRKHQQERREKYVNSKTENHANRLKKLGFKITINAENAHIIIGLKDEAVDYWATTESYFFRKRKIRGKGIKSLLSKIKESEKA